MSLRRCLLLLALASSLTSGAPAVPAPADYAAVAAIFNKHCLDCHAVADPEKNLVLETFDLTMKGGDSGKAILPGKSSASLLVQMLEGREGKKVMPPGKRKKLEPAQIAVIRAWIDAGAPAPKESLRLTREIVTPKIVPKAAPRRAIHAVAHSPEAELLAVARYGEVELVSTKTRAVVKTLTGHRGHVNAAVFSQDGKLLATAAGEAGLFGEAKLWNVEQGELIRTLEGHTDALYSIAISPDGQTLATGSYDQKIKLWSTATGVEARTLSGHNGAVFGLAFRPDGKVLASASGDRTVKLWDVTSGQRRDTLSQSLKELYTVAFAPDGRRLVAGGVDSRIRVWAISASALDGTNELLESKFAHEGPILNLVFATDGKSLLSSAEDRTVKVWNADNITERLLLETQPDQAPAVVFATGNRTLVIGRLDGTLEFYDATTGKVTRVVARN